MDANGTLAFQKSNHKRYTEFGRHAQTHVDMVRHQVALNKFDPSLPAKILYYLPYPFSKLAVQLLLAKLRRDNRIVLVFQMNMRYALLNMHRFFLLLAPLKALPVEEPILFLNETVEPFRVHH